MTTTKKVLGAGVLVSLVTVGYITSRPPSEDRAALLKQICNDARSQCHLAFEHGYAGRPNTLGDICKPDGTPFEEWCDGRGGMTGQPIPH
ncbi:MAG: hypothetical protein ACLPJH_00315 [Myxococcaceae bacterium]